MVFFVCLDEGPVVKGRVVKLVISKASKLMLLAAVQ